MKRNDGSWTNLYVNLTGPPGAGGGGDAGPHDHDYLPLSGGTLTGNLRFAGGKSPSHIYEYDDDTRTMLRIVAGGDHVSSGAMLSMYGGDDPSRPDSFRFYTNNSATLDLNKNGSASFHGDLIAQGNVGFKISSSNAPGAGVGELKAGNGASLRLYSEGDTSYANRIMVNASIFDMDPGCRLLVRGDADVKGKLKVDGQVLGSRGTQTAPTFATVHDPTSGFYAGDFGSGMKSAAISVDGEFRVSVLPDTTTVTNNLRVDGKLNVGDNLTVVKAGNQAVVQSDYFRAYAGSAAAPAFSFYGYPHLGIYLSDSVGVGTIATSSSLHVSGTIYGTLAHQTHAAGDFIVDNVLGMPGALSDVGTLAAPPNLAVDSWGWVRRTGWTPSKMAFAPSKLTRDSDVLERAETATLPPDPDTDDDGNILNADEIEAHDTVPLFEVVTALLAKVKELSVRIEELEGKA